MELCERRGWRVMCRCPDSEGEYRAMWADDEDGYDDMTAMVDRGGSNSWNQKCVHCSTGSIYAGPLGQMLAAC